MVLVLRRAAAGRGGQAETTGIGTGVFFQVTPPCRKRRDQTYFSASPVTALPRQNEGFQTNQFSCNLTSCGTGGEGRCRQGSEVDGPLLVAVKEKPRQTGSVAT